MERLVRDTIAEANPKLAARCEASRIVAELEGFGIHEGDDLVALSEPFYSTLAERVPSAPPMLLSSMIERAKTAPPAAAGDTSGARLSPWTIVMEKCVAG
jgi:hypothetical protein